MTTVWGINNIKEIGIVSYNDKYWIIDPNVFNSVVANKSVNGGENKAPKANDWFHDPVSGYEIKQSELSNLSKGIIKNADYNQENITRGDTAWHSNGGDLKSGDFDFWGGGRATGKYTEFYKLFWKECRKFTDRGFKCFNGNCFGGLEFDAKNWIYVDLEGTSYTGYLRIFYRTWDDFLSICNSNYNQNDCYQGLVDYSNNCKNSDQRFNNNCKKACDEKWTDGTIRNNCNQGLINYSSNCRNGNQVKDNNCTFTCDAKWSDGTLRNNCEYGNAQWCNDNDNFKSSSNYSFCEKYIEDSQNQFNNMPYNRFKELTTNNPNQDFSKNYLKNNNINTKFINDINKDCDFSVNRNNYDKCKKFINNSDFLGGKFVNWCKDNMDDNNCKDLLKDNASLRDRANNLYLTSICSQSDKIIKDNRCKGFLDADNDNLNIKNDAEDILAKYCNTNNKTFTLDDPSCYRIASKKCITATSNEDKEACNKYYVNIIKKLEEKSKLDDNVLYIYYDNPLFSNLPIFYQLKKNINLTNLDNPKNLNSSNQSILIDMWSAKIFAFIQPSISGNFTFQLTADDGLRFWINGSILLNNYPDYTATKESSKINLNKDIIYFFYFEFYENYGGAVLNIKYKVDNETEYKDIPDSWYKPFKLFQTLTNTYEDSMLNYMINYPQNFLSDNNYKSRLKNENPNVYNGIIEYCKKDNRLINDNNDCTKYVKNIVDTINKNSNYNPNQNNHKDCDKWADSGECTNNSIYMLDNCAKSCNEKKKNNLFNNLFNERLKICVNLLQTSNYTNEYATNYILKELIPYLKKINNNNITNIYTYLTTNNVINQAFFNFAENDANIEFTNNYIKSIYTEFKDISDIINSMKNIIVKRCKKVDSTNTYRFSTEDQCKNYITTDTGLNQSIVDYCNLNDNMKNQYCTDLDNSIIEGRKSGKTLPVNIDLANKLNDVKINYVKNIIKNKNQQDDYSIKYINNQYKTLIDSQNTNVTDRNKKYLEMIDKDTIKYCEDNYLEYENTTKPLCKQTYTTYKSVPEINNSINKIKEQNCLYNNKFITDTECQTYANDDKNYIKFINANNKYCSTGDNITNQYCQDYYKNTENKINQLLIQNNCNNFSSFDNKEDEKTLHNVELESFNNNTECTFYTEYTFYFIMFIIFVFLIVCLFMNPSNKKNKNNNKK